MLGVKWLMEVRIRQISSSAKLGGSHVRLGVDGLAFWLKIIEFGGIDEIIEASAHHGVKFAFEKRDIDLVVPRVCMLSEIENAGQRRPAETASSTA